MLNQSNYKKFINCTCFEEFSLNESSQMLENLIEAVQEFIASEPNLDEKAKELEGVIKKVLAEVMEVKKVVLDEVLDDWENTLKQALEGKK